MDTNRRGQRVVAELMELERYSLGVGDRFARQAPAQLRACIAAAQNGVEVVINQLESFKVEGNPNLILEEEFSIDM